MSGYFPQQQSWPWMQGSPYGGQQQQYSDQTFNGYGNAWPGMQGGYGGYQQAAGQNYGGYNLPMGGDAYYGGQQQYGQYQPQAQAAAAPDSNLGDRRQRLNSQIGNLQQQYAAAGTQDQGAIQQQMQGLQGRLQNVKGQIQDQRQGARQAANAPAPGQAPGAGGYTPPTGATSFNNPGSSGWVNPNAQGGQPGMSIGTQAYNTQFGQLVPSSGGNGNLYKVAGGGEGPGQTYAFQNGQWGQANNSDALAHQYTTTPTGPGSGQVMQTSNVIDQNKLRAQGML